ncbi:MAG TPA: hypothetical protein VF797_10655, partial [Noviherbaspirillum sp.]
MTPITAASRRQSAPSKKFKRPPCIPKPAFAIVRLPPQHSAAGAEKGSMLVRFFEAKRKKTVDDKQQM